MFFRKWQKGFFTVPNLLSMFRLALLPVYVSIYLKASTPGQYYLAGGILAVSCMTDAVDGQIARRWNAVTTVGKILDPLADKVTQFTLTVCLTLRYPVLKPVLILFVIKELLQCLAGLVQLHRGKILPGAILEGKICTTVLFVSLILLVLFPELPIAAVKSIALTDSLFLVLSFVGYSLAYFGRNPKIQDLREP